MRRQMKQSKMMGESEISKIEKITLIDLEYFKKCIQNEPLPNFEAILSHLDK